MSIAHAQQNVPGVVFTEESSGVGTEGYVTLRWNIEGEEDFEAAADYTYILQQDSDRLFTSPEPRYRGPELGSVLTGFEEGTYYFRVRAMNETGVAGPWSEPFEFNVQYADMRLVIALMVTGLIVFALTVGTIVAGHHRTKGTANA